MSQNIIKTRIGVFGQGQILCISPNGLQAGHCDAIYCISRHFRSIGNFFFTKWLPPAILDDRKSLSIAFLAISVQYSTFISLIWFTKWLPAAILDDRKSLSIAFLAISDQYATFFSQNGCRRPFWMTENHFRLHFSPFQFNTQLLFL